MKSTAPRWPTVRKCCGAGILQSSGRLHIEVAVVDADCRRRSWRKRRLIVRGARGSSMLDGRIPLVFDVADFLRTNAVAVCIFKVRHIRDHVEKPTVGVGEGTRIIKQQSARRIYDGDSDNNSLYVRESI